MINTLDTIPYNVLHMAIPAHMRRSDMLNQYKFCRHYIALGETILIYRGVTTTKTSHVTDVNRLTYVDGIMYLDGVSCKGMTIVRKP